jgi:hypothetical protein
VTSLLRGTEDFLLTFQQQPAAQHMVVRMCVTGEHPSTIRGCVCVCVCVLLCTAWEGQAGRLGGAVVAVRLLGVVVLEHCSRLSPCPYKGHWGVVQGGQQSWAALQGKAPVYGGRSQACQQQVCAVHPSVTHSCWEVAQT